jgi:hypothetical protein
MKKSLIVVLSACILVIALVGLFPGTAALLGDSEQTAGNYLEAGEPDLWTQTTRADFESGWLSDVDIASSPDNVKLSRTAAAELVTSDNTEVQTESQSYLLVKTLSFTKSGSVNTNLRIDTDVRASKWNNAVASIRLRINSTVYTHETENTGYVIFSDLLDLGSYEDGSYSVSLYLKINKNNVSAYNTLFEIYNITTSSYTDGGTAASRVLDTGNSGSKWNALFWDSDLPAGTSLQFEGRSSDSSFNIDDTALGWTSLDGDSPLLSGLPGGRFIQWRAKLATNNNKISPILKEVRLYYFP